MSFNKKKTQNKPKKQYNPYQILKIDRRASQAEIKKAYFKLVRQFPPEEAPERFKKIRKAYEDLKDKKRRAEIDLFLLHPPPELPNYRAVKHDFRVHNKDLIALTVETKLEGLPIKQDYKIPKIQS